MADEEWHFTAEKCHLISKKCHFSSVKCHSTIGVSMFHAISYEKYLRVRLETTRKAVFNRTACNLP